uniref:Uncharacterized protein n=1 Tax=Avena sativa TaxID=4498 RepID=A0ACD5TSM0_AVESA
MSSSSKSSGLLAMALLAALFAGARCAAPAPPVTFTVEAGSNEKHLAVLVSCQGDSMVEVALRENASYEWVDMSKGEGGVWTFDSEEPLQGPFNFRICTEKRMKDVFDDVIPDKYTIGATYTPREQ